MQLSKLNNSWSTVEVEGKLWHTMKNAPINELKLYDFANQNGFCSISHLAFGIFTIFHFPFGISHGCRRLDDAAQRSLEHAACGMQHA